MLLGWRVVKCKLVRPEQSRCALTKLTMTHSSLQSNRCLCAKVLKDLHSFRAISPFRHYVQHIKWWVCEQSLSELKVQNMKLSLLVGADSSVGSALTYSAVALRGDPSLSPGLWTFPNPVPLFLSQFASWLYTVLS